MSVRNGRPGEHEGVQIHRDEVPVRTKRKTAVVTATYESEMECVDPWKSSVPANGLRENVVDSFESTMSNERNGNRNRKVERCQKKQQIAEVQEEANDLVTGRKRRRVTATA